MPIVRPLLCSCLALLACAPASAQTVGGRQNTRPERPYRGVFAGGGAGGGDEGGQSLTGSATVSGGYDDNLLADATQRSNPFRGGQQGTLGQFSGSLNYSLDGDRGQLEAGAGTSLRYYPSLDTPTFKTYNANIDGEWVALKKPNLVLEQSVGYQPFTFLSDLGANATTPSAATDLVALVPPEVDFVPIASQYMVYDGAANLSVKLTSRTTVTSGYGYHIADRNNGRTWRQSGTLGTSFGLTKDLSLRLAYRYMEAHYTTRVVRTHTPDVGLDFEHALSLTRRTSLTFAAGVQAYVVRDRTTYRLTGNVNVSHEIGRSWAVNGSYSRGTNFLDTLPEPVFADAGRVSLSGLITRRINFEAAATASVGNSGFSQTQRFSSYRGTLTLSTAINRYMNVGLDYAYYSYNFAQGTQLEAGLPLTADRQSIRGSVSFWAPLMNKTRRRNATR